SMNMAVNVAVIDFVQEPMWNLSSIVTGVGSPCLRTPTAARSQIFPSFTTATASAGRSCFLRMGSNMRAVSPDGVPAKVFDSIKAEASVPAKQIGNLIAPGL